jgi:hypothetical protein
MEIQYNVWSEDRMLPKQLLQISALFLLFFLPLPVTGTQSNWELVKKSGNIKVFHRRAEENRGEFKGIGEFDAGIDEIGLVLEDVSGEKEWIPFLMESRILHKTDENHMVIYQLYDFIWPLYDRDIVADVTVQKDYRTRKVDITMKAIPSGLVPPRQRTIRMEKWKSRLQLEYLGRKRTRVVYTARVDLGGTLPGWLTNILNREIPFRFLDELGRAVKKEKYQQAAKQSPYGRNIEDAIEEGQLPE